MTRRAKRPAIVDFAALSSVAIAGLLIGLMLGPASRSASLASPGASVIAARRSPTSTSRPVAGPSVRPSQPGESPPVPPGPCAVPAQLPAPPAAIAAPRVQARNLAVVFASFLYDQSPDGRLLAQDTDARHGLWFAAPGATEARLLVAVEAGGAVLPLGLSRSGDEVAVWYMPESRVWGGPACPTGIYVLSTRDGTSRLVIQRDWRVVLDDSRPIGPLDRTGPTWPAGQTASFDTIVHRLPTASFSANGRSVALIEQGAITVKGPGKNAIVTRHTAECSSWAWSPSGATLVAGCDQMTSAWTIDVGEGYGEEFYPLPLPDREGLFRNWDQWPASTIGLTRAGDIRLVRFYGFATGCEGPADSGCFIPRPAWSVQTIDPASGAVRSRYTELDFLSDVNEVGQDARLAADASWVYIRGYYGDRARVVSVGSGETVVTRRLGDSAGESADGRLLFDARVDHDRAVVLVRSLDRAGTIREVGTIAWPEGAVTSEPVIATFGLEVAWVRS